MTETDPVTGPGPSPAPELPRDPDRAVDEQAYRSRSSWPATRLAGVLLTTLLGLSVAGPATVASLRASQWPALLLPAALATLSARLTFEAFDSGARGHGIRSHLVPAATGALLATLFMAGASVVLGLRWTAAVGAATAVLAAATLLGAGAVRDLEIRVRLALRRVFFVGSTEARSDLATELAHSREAQLVGALGVQAVLNTSSIMAAVESSQATVLVVDLEALRLPAVVEAASQLNLAGIHVRELIGYYEAEFKKVPLAELTPTWFLFDIASVHERPVSRLLRRVLELLISALLLLVAVPLILGAMVAIRLTSPGPGLYRQRRVGRHGAQFTLFKLRTMTEADQGPAWASAEAHRITAVGRLLRKYRVDELPQLWNVIHGDLALVGPRPEQVAIAEELDRQIPFYSARQSVRPGLTGWAQVNMGYGGSFEGTLAKLQRDLFYVKHGSFRLDCLIMWLTLKTILTGRG
jgi:lipopolysaccharide/colanic/teichoic acid biosynthesis glycosyltransferase